MLMLRKPTGVNYFELTLSDEFFASLTPEEKSEVVKNTNVDIEKKMRFPPSYSRYVLGNLMRVMKVRSPMRSERPVAWTMPAWER